MIPAPANHTASPPGRKREWVLTIPGTNATVLNAMDGHWYTEFTTTSFDPSEPIAAPTGTIGAVNVAVNEIAAPPKNQKPMQNHHRALTLNQISGNVWRSGTDIKHGRKRCTTSACRTAIHPTCPKYISPPPFPAGRYH